VVLRVLLASLLATAIILCLSWRAERARRAATAPLHTEGNRIRLPDGTPWMGRGVNVFDTRSCGACGDGAESLREAKRRIDEAVDVWGATFVRLCLQSETAAQSVLQDDAYLEGVRELVAHVGTKRGVYVLVSLWRDPSVGPEGWPTEDTARVWTRLAQALDDQRQALYGIVNEPRHNLDGGKDGEVWRRMNDTVAAIRNVETSLGADPHIVVVQGTRDYGRWLDYYVEHPIRAAGGRSIAYETHPYSDAGQLERMIVEPSRRVPVLIGEFGPNDFGSRDFRMSYEDAQAVIEIAEREGIPYSAFSFHMRCPPNLLVDHSAVDCGVGMPLEPTAAWGEMVRDALRHH
jgi:Cellulase (glycosyl hydrolase family 5)